jgi:hypothetical protein
MNDTKRAGAGRILIKLILIILMGLVSEASLVSAADNRGAADMMLSGGARGAIPFPHGAHQVRIVDCNICHVNFPQQSGGIEALKKAGTLKKKQVMKRCTTCHRDTKKAGKKSGPTRCKTCHQR